MHYIFACESMPNILLGCTPSLTSFSVCLLVSVAPKIKEYLWHETEIHAAFFCFVREIFIALTSGSHHIGVDLPHDVYIIFPCEVLSM